MKSPRELSAAAWAKRRSGRIISGGFWVCLIIGNNLLAGFEEMAASGAEAVALDDSVAFHDGIADADLALGAAGAGNLGGVEAGRGKHGIGGE